jgi:hypothetical protein
MAEPLQLRYAGCLAAMGLPRLTAEAELIVVGRVGQAAGSFVVQLPQLVSVRMVFTAHWFEVTSSLKGLVCPGGPPSLVSPVKLPVITFGGKTQAVEATVDGEAQMSPGESAVLFLTSGLTRVISPTHLPPGVHLGLPESPVLSILGGYQGKLSVVGEGATRTVRMNDSGELMPFASFVNAVRGAL